MGKNHLKSHLPHDLPTVMQSICVRDMKIKEIKNHTRKMVLDTQGPNGEVVYMTLIGLTVLL